MDDILTPSGIFHIQLFASHCTNVSHTNYEFKKKEKRKKKKTKSYKLDRIIELDFFPKKVCHLNSQVMFLSVSFNFSKFLMILII